MRTPTAVDAAVKERYRRGARQRASDLCCPVDYDPRYVEAIPREVLDRDYGWRTVEGIEFRSMTVEALKGKQGACCERNQAVVYKGPFKEVLDDDGHRMERGKRYAVGDKTFRLYRRAPYRDAFEFIEPREEIPRDEAAPFDGSRTPLRHPRETKGEDHDLTTEAEEPCCGPERCC